MSSFITNVHIRHFVFKEKRAYRWYLTIELILNLFFSLSKAYVNYGILKYLFEGKLNIPNT